ncbi:MAG: carboxylating nicotinate-nucleotide diphosphorylase [Nitrospinales bacterium]
MIQPPTKEQIQWLVRLGLEEDLGPGDITSENIVTPSSRRKATVTAKEPLILCGRDIASEVFLHLDSTARFFGSFMDGERADAGATLFTVEADELTLLKGERTALNILQRLSGIATLTRQFADRAKPVTVLDTRKTTPGLRVFEKYAVACGGGKNHRFGLFDAVLIKDNHIKSAGGISQAVKRLRAKLPSHKIEVETANLDEVAEAVKMAADVILLDNMSPDTIRQAVALVAGKAKIEVSGSVSLDNLEALAATGVDFVSVGALTHSARAVDISMNFCP